MYKLLNGQRSKNEFYQVKPQQENIILFCKSVDITGYPKLEELIRACYMDIHWFCILH